MKKTFGILLTLALVLSFSLVVTTPVAAATITVGPGGPPTYDYATIQAAVDAANPGDTINVVAGTYTEAVTINPGADLTIQGAGRDITTWIAPADDPSRMHCVQCALTGYAGTTTLDISGFTFSVEDNLISNSGIAIYINKARTGPLYLDIHDNKFVETTTIADETANSMLLCHNRYAARVGGVAPVKIHDNLDYTNGGIAMSNTRAFDIYNNTFDGCSDALYIGYGCPTSTTIGDHHIYNNTFKNASNTYLGGPWPSIFFSYYGSGTGMTFLPSTIENNTFDSNDVAIGYSMDSAITYPADIIRFNNFDNNMEAMRVFGSHAASVDASANWWGSSDPTTVAGMISGGVDFTPLLDSGTDTDQATPGFQPSLSSLTVHTLGSQSGSIGRIQEGINLVSGSTVHVAAGTYNEMVTVNKDVTVTGVGSPVVIGSSPAFVITADGATVEGFDAQSTNHSVIWVAANNVTVRNNKVTGHGGADPPGGNPGDTAGIYVIGTADYTHTSWPWPTPELTGITLENNEILNTTHAAICLNRVASSTVKGNNIHNLRTDATGIALQSASCSPTHHVTVEGNNISISGSSIGILVVNSHTNTIRNNTIQNSTYYGVCLRTFACDNSVHDNSLTCNNILNNGVAGIYLHHFLPQYGGSWTTVSDEAHNNNIVGNGVGVKNDVADAFDAEENWWDDASGPTHTSNPGGTGDAVTDNVDFTPWCGEAYGPTKGVATSTGTGTASFTTSDGNILDLAAVATPPFASFALPHGMFSFEICCIDPGQTVTLTITLPKPLPAGAKWWKYRAGKWYSLPIGSDNGDNIITITLTDGVFPGDADSIAGQITDPGGPGYVVAACGFDISSTEGGSVTTPGEGAFLYACGRVVDLVASPDAGYKFVNWSGDVSTIADVHDASTTISVQGWYSITANFASEVTPTVERTLTISSTGGGSVTSPGEGTSVYKAGTVVNLVASPANGYKFVNWTGDGISHPDFATTTITMNGDYSIKANFAFEQTTTDSTEGSSGPLACFIATAAYGTPTAEQIDVLREFRDAVLLESAAGSQFVTLYYQLSPPIADFVAGNELLRTLVRELLVDPVVWVVDATGAMWRN